jgi:hypothetical protein
VSILLGVDFGHRDLPSHFVLWGFLKEIVYSNIPRSFEKLKHNTEQTSANIYPETLRKVAQYTLKRVDASLSNCGEHFERLR